MSIDKNRAQSKEEETLNWISHSFGILLTLAVAPFLLKKSYAQSSLVFYATNIFIAGMLMVYTCSSLYHYVSKPTVKARLKIADHISIYYLIAGTYTPLMIKYLDWDTSFLFLGIMWMIVFIGSILKLFYTNRFETFSVILYLVLGWMILFVIRPILAVIPDQVLHRIIVGGLSYSVGVYFYIKGHKMYYHFIWHLFVLFGTIAHCWAIWLSMD